MTTRKKISFEESIEELERILNELEVGRIPIDEAFALFEKGLGISNSIRELLSSYERKVRVLMDSAKPDSERGLKAFEPKEEGGTGELTSGKQKP